MRVSVVIPCFNAANFVDAAIRSVREQSTAVHEIIAVNDGSTDDTLARLSAHAGVTILSQENAGAAAARNLGIRHATGEVIALLDADDLFTPESIAARLRLLTPTVDAVGGVVEHFHDGALGHSTAEARSPMRARLPSALVFRRSLFQDIGGFDPTIRLGEAIEWFARFDLANRRLVWTDAVVLRRRVHDHNSSGDTERLRREYLTALRRTIANRRLGEAT